MTKGQLREYLKELVEQTKTRSLNGYTLEFPSIEAVALRNAELSGAYQVLDQLIDFIEINMEDE
jgi:hypothetical protein